MQDHVPQFTTLLIVVLVIFAIYRRFRRTFGRQPLRPTRMRGRMLFLSIIGILLAQTALRSSAFLAAIPVGLACGAALACFGAARTRFERDGNDTYYIPHTYTGLAVSLLFVGRVVYRLVQVYFLRHSLPDAGAGVNPADVYVQSPLTLGMFYLVMGYYICYYSLVLSKAKKLAAATGGPLEPPAAGDSDQPAR